MSCWVSPAPSEVISLGIICQIQAETPQAKHPGPHFMPTLVPVPSGAIKPLPMPAPGEQNPVFDPLSAPTQRLMAEPPPTSPCAVLTESFPCTAV